ncbi:MAG: MFS transporter [Saccharofermentanales bacterium]|jgi:GPH family glycoside/pentoside/hexuronide:cation symporter
MTEKKTKLDEDIKKDVAEHNDSEFTFVEGEDPMGVLPVKRKLAYGLGDLGANFSWTFIGSFLMYFWTDILGVTAAFTGTIMLLSRFWDAINDPLVGSWADRTQTKWGKYRPWLIACIPMAFMNVLAFTPFKFGSQTAKDAYAFIMFFILVFVFTCMNIPYSAMQTVMTLNPNERSSVASWRLTFAYTGMFIINIATLPLVNLFGGGNEGKGYFFTAILYSFGIMLPLFMICFFGTKEIVHHKPKKPVRMRDNIKILKGNTPVWLLAICFLCFGFYNYGRAATAMYYFTYNVGDKALFPYYSFFNMGGNLVGSMLMPRFAVRVQNKALIPRYGFIFTGVILCIMGLVSPTDRTAIYIIFGLQLLASLGQGVASSGMHGMVADSTDFTHYKYGVRAGGFISAFNTFMQKMGIGLGTASIGWALGATGYVAGQAQSASTLNAINIIFTYLPGVIAIAAGLSMFAYKIDKETLKGMMKSIGAYKE